MRGKKAKAIRRSVYGEDFSPKARKYGFIKRIKKIFVKDDKGVPQKVDRVTGQVVNTGLRAEYLKRKKEARQ